MPIEKFKDVTIAGHEFRLGLVSALQGMWILQNLAGHSNPETFARVQDYLFSACCVYHTPKSGTRAPLKIYDSGRWLYPDLELEYDTDLADALFTAAFEFNLGPTLRRRVQERLAAAEAMSLEGAGQDMTPSSSQRT